MPPASPQYTLVGFSPELDWRPLTFLKPIPAYRVCSACSLVRKKTALLPCMHVLCESCYEQCARDGSHVCPLEGNHYEERDVDLKDFPDEDLLSREVKCWNEGSGCEHASAASEIAQHFRRECEHHCVSCANCTATVLCSDVCAHLRSASCVTSVPLASECQTPLIHLDERALLTSLKCALERRVDEISASLRPMAADVGTNSDRLNEISHSINALKETLRQELEAITEKINNLTEGTVEMTASNEGLQEQFATTSESVDSLSINIADLEQTLKEELGLTRDSVTEIGAAIEQVSAEVKENGPKVLEFLTSVLRHSELQVVQCVFSVKEVKSLQETATPISGASYDSEQVYLRGYCITPGVRFAKGSDSALLQGRYTLHKGDMDEIVSWPFKHEIRLSVIHPKGGEERAVVCKPKPWATANQKPTTSSNESYICIYDDHLTLQALVNDGYIENDELRVKWKLLP